MLAQSWPHRCLVIHEINILFALCFFATFRLLASAVLSRLKGTLQKRTNEGEFVPGAVSGHRVGFHSRQRVEYDCNHLPGCDRHFGI